MDSEHSSSPGAFRGGHISVEQSLELIRKRLGEREFRLIDVRTPAEYAALRLEGGELLDSSDPGILARLNAMPREHTYLLYCRSGNRSGMVMEYMGQSGFREAYNMSGGILRWLELGLPTISGPDED